MDAAGLKRCQELFTELLHKAQHGAVAKQVCTAAAEAGASCLGEIERLSAAPAKLPRNGEDYPLSLLVATKKALLRVCEDPTLEDARAVLEKIDAAILR